MNYTRRNQIETIKGHLAFALGVILVWVVGFALAPWVLKAIVWFFNTCLPFYFTYFNHVMGVKPL